MRKPNQEIIDKQILEDILSQATVCRIAMIDHGAPYLLPFNYGYRDKCLYIHSAAGGKKINALSLQPRVCFEVEQQAGVVKGPQACDWTTLYRSVIGYGTVEIIREHALKIEGLEIIMAQHGAPELTAFKKKNVDAVVILKLNIDSMTGKQSGNWNRVMQQASLNLKRERMLLEVITRDDLQ